MAKDETEALIDVASPVISLAVIGILRVSGTKPAPFICAVTDPEALLVVERGGEAKPARVSLISP